MKSLCISLTLISLFDASALAQPNPDTLWTRTYGGDSVEWVYSVHQTSDSGYVVAGWTHSFGAGDWDYYLVKTTIQGDTLWTRTFGGSYWDYLYDAQPTTDGGYIMAGKTNSFGAGGYDCYIVKTDSLGNPLWTRSYGDSHYDDTYSIRQTADSGYVAAGCTGSFGAGYFDFYLVRTSGLGDTIWTRTYGGILTEEAKSVRQTTDRGFVIAGYTWSFGVGYTDFYLVKIDDRGDTVWTRTYGGTSMDVAYCVQETSDAGYILAGYTASFGAGNDDFYLVRTDSQGDTIWTRTYGGLSEDCAQSIQQTADGGFIVAGYTYFLGAYDFYVLKIDGQGEPLWTRTYGGSGWERASCIQQTTDGGYIIGGYTTSFGAGAYDFYLVKTGPDISEGTSIEIGLPSQYILYPAFPNPFNPSTQITFSLPKTGEISLTVFNLLGQEVVTLAHGMQSAGTHAVTFDGSDLPSGIYLCRLKAGDFVHTQKMVLLK